MAQKINVDVTPGLFQQTLYYHQGDVGREFEIEIATKDGYTIPSGATFTIQATKPSGFGFTVTGTATGNVVAFTSTEEMTDEFGRFPAQLKIADGTDTIFTANFLMVGEIDVHPDGTTDGSQETIIPTLTLLVERVENAAAAVLDTTTEVTTLPAGSQATYSFDEETNTATFGIPQGEAGAGSAGVVASAYSASKTYAVGDYAIHNSNLYRCTTAITTAESFTASHWTQVVLADDVTDLKSDLGNIDLTELFELGGVYTDNGFVYTNTNTRIRTKKGTTLPFIQGKKIGLTDYSNARFYACWRNKSGEYKYSGWKTADYTIAEDGDYVIMIANTQETPQTDETALASLFFGYQAVAFDYIIGNKNRIDSLESVGYVTNPGFIKANGEIIAQTDNKEVYTNKILVTNGMIIDISLSFSTIRSGWVAYATYTSSGAFISRTVLLDSVNVNKYSGEVVITDTNVSYIAFTYRTYDDCTMSITSPQNIAILYKAIQNTNELNIRESLCPIILSGSASNYYVDVIINSTESSITFPTDTLLLFRDGSYKSLPATTFNFDSSVISTTAIKIVYSRSTETLKAIRFDRNVADNEVLVATIRRNTACPSVFINCAYRLNGHLYGVNVADQIGDTNPIIKSVNHRGYYTAPENTLPAYKLSKKNGFKYVECDVSFTSDGIPVLLHDNTINRTARNADGTTISEDININDITYQQALTYDFGIYKSTAYTGTKIPKLEDFLVLCRNLGLHPYVELKSSATYSESQIRSLIDMAKKCGMKNNLTWISFKSAFLTYIKNYDAEARLGYVVDNITEANITRANNLMTEENEVFLDCDYTQLTDETIALCINANIPLEVWTVDTINEITALNPYITGVTSDNLVAGNVLYNANI